MNSSSMQHEMVNLGSEAKPKYFNLGKCCSLGERCKFIKLFQQYKDIFAYMYEDLNNYDTRINQHTIPIKTWEKPFKQQLRKMHLKLEPLIFKVRNFEWVANLVPVRKKSGEIRLCVEFRNLNRASDKDNYPVPPMEHILQMVSGSEMFSLLDGFFRI